MIIDCHTHICDLRSPGTLHREPLTVDNLIARLDDEGIDRAVVLPWPASPEAVQFPGLFAPACDIVSQIRATDDHPDRLIPFGNVDPRWGGNSSRADFGWLLDMYVAMGCAGVGEVAPNLPFDDPRVINLFQQCGQWDLPVTIESTGWGEGHYGMIDEPGAPRLDRLLREAPETIVIGHGPGFWAEIGAGLTPEQKCGYPSGPIDAEGALPRLLRAHSNLYADISATSGYNALTRDEAFGLRFLDEFQDRLLFATDVCFADAEGRAPQLGWLRGLVAGGPLSPEAFDKIAGGNAQQVLTRAAL